MLKINIFLEISSYSEFPSEPAPFRKKDLKRVDYDFTFWGETVWFLQIPSTFFWILANSVQERRKIFH